MTTTSTDGPMTVDRRDAYCRQLLRLTTQAHRVLDDRGVERRSSPITWEIFCASTPALTEAATHD